MKHAIAWCVVVAVVLFCIIKGPDAKADELIIMHPGTEEFITGSFEQEYNGYVDFIVDDYESYVFDTIMKDGFDSPEGDTDRQFWRIKLEFPQEGDEANFIYICSSKKTSYQLFLYCVN